MGKKGNKRNKNITILLVPEDSSKITGLKLKMPLFLFLAVLLLVSIFSSAYIVTRHVNYRATIEYNKYLNRKHKVFTEEVLRAREAVKRVSEIDTQLRQMLELKSKDGIMKYTGFGGPSDIDPSMLEKYIKDRDENVSIPSLKMAVKFVNEESRNAQKSFQGIVKYITEQRAKMSAVPSDWPVKGWITAGFGSRIDPFSGSLSFHEGVDIANDRGTPIKATADGVVNYAAFERGYGHVVILNHANGYTTRYGHMKKYVVSPGEHIKKEQVIGYMGSSGRSTAPHLHYEVRLNGVAVNPTKYLNKKVAFR